MSDTSIEPVAEIAVIYSLMFISETQGIPLKKCLEQLRDRGCSQAPNAEIDEILIKLGPRSKTAAELAGKPNKTHTQCDREASGRTVFTALSHREISLQTGFDKKISYFISSEQYDWRHTPTV